MRLLIRFQAVLLPGLLALTSPALAWAQAAGERDEQVIRELAERVGRRSPADEQQVRQVYANDAVFVSGAYPRPRIGRDTSVKPVKEVQALVKWPIPNKMTRTSAPADGLWIRRVLVRAQEGQCTR